MSELKETFDVTLIKENVDGSAVFQFNLSQEALDALTRFGIITAIKAGIEEAKLLNPDFNPEETQEETYKRAMRDAVGLLKTQHELVKERHNYMKWAANLIQLEFLEEDDEQ
jgi:hypothetical protein